MGKGMLYIGGILLGLGAGFIAGSNYTRYNEKPVAVYERQIGGDQRNFLNLELRNGKVIPFVEGNLRGTFKRLDEVQSDENEALLKKVKERDNPNF